MMTKRERLGKEQVMKRMSEQGYPTYASLLNLFDLHLTKDPEVVGYMIPEQAVICINEELDIDQVSMVVRHEILHEFLEHHQRAKKHGIPDQDHQLANIAGDYEISNLGYTDKDKVTARALRLGKRIVSGLVTDYDHPDWVDKTYEEMYDLLKKESPQSSNSPQIGDRGNSQTQQAEAAQRRAQAIKDIADSSMDQDKGDSSDSDPGSTSNSSSDSDSNSEGGEDKDSKSSGSGSGEKKKRNKYDDDDYKNMSPEEKKKERARRRKEEAKRLKEEAEKVENEIKDLLDEKKESQSGKEGGDPFDTPEEKQERSERIAKIQKVLRDLNKQAEVLQESTSVMRKERAQKEAKDSKKFRNNSLTRFTESLNKFIRDALARSRNSSWAHINKKYVYSGLLRPGSTSHASGNVPLIHVYFDRSGSWDSAKTEKGSQAISTLNKYVTRGEIVIKLFYFNDKILDHDPGGQGGTRGQPILDHIEQTKPNNVIILTDSDISDCRTNVTVDGAVWFLWYETDHNMIADHLSGKKLTREFRVE